MNWEYISGFFDADGSVTLVKVGSKNEKKTLQISFSNNEKGILKKIERFIHNELGFSGSISVKSARKPSHKDSYELKYVYSQAHVLSKNIKSHHPKKKHRIKTYKKIQEIVPRNGKYSKQILAKRNDLERDFFKIMK